MFLYHAVALVGSAANADTWSRGHPIWISVTTSTGMREVSHGGAASIGQRKAACDGRLWVLTGLAIAADCGDRRLCSTDAQPVGDFKAAVVVWRSKAKVLGGYTTPGGVRERPHGE